MHKLKEAHGAIKQPEDKGQEMFNREFNMEDATLVLDQPFKIPEKKQQNSFLAPVPLGPKKNSNK